MNSSTKCVLSFETTPSKSLATQPLPTVIFSQGTLISNDYKSAESLSTVPHYLQSRDMCRPGDIDNGEIYRMEDFHGRFYCHTNFTVFYFWKILYLR